MGKVQINFDWNSGHVEGDKFVMKATARVPLDHIVVLPNGKVMPMSEQAVKLLIEQHGFQKIILPTSLKSS